RSSIPLMLQRDMERRMPELKFLECLKIQRRLVRSTESFDCDVTFRAFKEFIVLLDPLPANDIPSCGTCIYVSQIIMCTRLIFFIDTVRFDSQSGVFTIY